MTISPTKLGTLRSRLGDLRRRRMAFRLATGFAGFSAAVLAILWAAFLVDFFLEMGRLERIVSLALVIFGTWMAARRLLMPHLGQRETDLDMALLVEGRMKIDSDLVAALQFEQPESRRWGSGQLREAVVDYVAEFGNTVDVFQGLSTAEFRRRCVALAGAIVLWLPFAVLYPRYIPVFVERLFLASLHYPTSTRITELRINGFLIKPGVVRMRYGRPLEFRVTVEGDVPASGEVRVKPRLKEDAGWGARLLDGLSAWAFAGSAPVLDSAATAIPLEPTGGSSILAGQTAPLTEPLEFQVFVGDAWTDPAPVDILPLPAIRLSLTPTPPDYARHLKLPTLQPGSQVLSVVESSRVDLTLECTNKGLRKATVKVGETEYPLERVDDHRHRWRLPVEGTPFEKVSEPFSFAVQVEDLDELSLDRPLVGHLRLVADREPRVTAAVVTERVLPTARPTIGYKATDDFGLAEVRLHRLVERVDGGKRVEGGDRVDGGMEQPEPLTLIKVPAGDQPVTQLPRDARGLHVDLAPLKLQKGDKVRVTVEVIDYRGRSPGKSAFTEPFVFEVTDQSGILEGLTEADQKSARQLDVIIQRQLGIGETR